MNDKPRLIDANALRERIIELKLLARDRVINTNTNSPCYARYAAQLGEREDLVIKIDAAPTIDAVPVVRCKGCGYSYQDERVKYMGKYWCGCHGQLRCPDDYCNEGYGKEASHD